MTARDKAEEIKARWIERAITAIIAEDRASRECCKAEREACASLSEEACLDIGATAIEAEGVCRRTRDAIAAAIRARSTTSPAEEKK